ncbi:MAG: hypothetical protein REI45_14830, partial [Propionicimonas sp.]|nr:hypothetical protein [Propionicimonas sp.]
MGRWHQAVLALVLCPLLTGCLTLTARLDIGVSGAVRYSVDLTASITGLAERGVPEDIDLCEVVSAHFPDDARLEPTRTADAVGCRIAGESPDGRLVDASVSPPGP